ncbi:MAG: RNB domain-containing ribonuclease, partial [Corynebacterium casei]|nr:RNB domain-containing ribonuclease [Corynebacterium casei]
MKLYAAHLDLSSIAKEFKVPTAFDAAVTHAAARARDQFAATRTDKRDIPLVTIDPEGSMDLDQAVFIDKPSGGAGYVVYYAIADVAAFVEPGGPIERESLERGQTIYLPDEPARLHPPELSEGEASLLPDVDRPAVLWIFNLDASGEVEDFQVERALVRSRARLDYDGAHADLVNGELHSSIALLPEVGKLRQASSLRRHAISLRLPSQRVVENEDGQFELVIEPRHEIMDYNSEISLLTGMCA